MLITEDDCRGLKLNGLKYEDNLKPKGLMN